MDFETVLSLAGFRLCVNVHNVSKSKAKFQLGCVIIIDASLQSWTEVTLATLHHDVLQTSCVPMCTYGMPFMCHTCDYASIGQSCCSSCRGKKHSLACPCYNNGHVSVSAADSRL